MGSATPSEDRQARIEAAAKRFLDAFAGEPYQDVHYAYDTRLARDALRAALDEPNVAATGLQRTYEQGIVNGRTQALRIALAVQNGELSQRDREAIENGGLPADWECDVPEPAATATAPAGGAWDAPLGASLDLPQIPQDQMEELAAKAIADAAPLIEERTRPYRQAASVSEPAATATAPASLWNAPRDAKLKLPPLAEPTPEQAERYEREASEEAESRGYGATATAPEGAMDVMRWARQLCLQQRNKDGARLGDTLPALHSPEPCDNCEEYAEFLVAFRDAATEAPTERRADGEQRLRDRIEERLEYHAEERDSANYRSHALPNAQMVGFLRKLLSDEGY